VRAVDLVVTDLDGTLWAHEGIVHDRTLEAWRDLERAGIGLLVATGRRATSTREPLGTFGLTPPAVLLDGALGIDFASGRRFHERAVPPAIGRRILDHFGAFGLSPVVYIDHPTLDAFVSGAPSTNPGHIALFGPTVAVGDLDEVVAHETVLAFGLVGVECGPVEGLAAAVASDRCGEARVNPSFDFGGCALTVVVEGLSKWDGVLAYCTETGIDPTRILAIGDGSNDVEMLRNAAIGCSLEGSSMLAISAADHVVGSVGSGGWAEILELV
jgi:hypothetical protein